MLSRVFTSSTLLKEPNKAAHALNAIGPCAKVAIIFGVNPIFFVSASRVGLQSAGTWSELRAAALGIVASLKVRRDQAHLPPGGAASAANCPDAPPLRTAA